MHGRQTSLTDFAPFAGQWAPIVGTGLAVLGSLYVLFAADAVDPEMVKEEANSNSSMHHCSCSMHDVGINHIETASSQSVAPLGATDMPQSHSNGDGGTPSEIVPTPTRSTTGQGHQAKRFGTTDAGNRRKVAKALTAVGSYLGTAAQDRFDVSDFKRGKALDYPELPGEEHRNPDLPQIRREYNQYRDADGNATPEPRPPSRAGSFIGSVGSRVSIEGSTTTPREASHHSPQSPHEPSSFELSSPPSSSIGSTGGMLRQRRDTLEVPSPTHHNPTRNNVSAFSTIPFVTIPKDRSPPIITVSSDPDTSSPTHAPDLNTPEPLSSSEPLPPPPPAALHPPP